MKSKFSFILSGFLALLFLISVRFCQAQTADSTIARQFIALNDQGNFSDAAKLMSPGFLGMVSPDNLQKIWYWHVQSQGKFHGVLSVKQMQQGKIFAVFPTCDFDKADITFAFAFDENHQIAGFHVDTVAAKTGAEPSSVPKALYQPDHSGENH